MYLIMFNTLIIKLFSYYLQEQLLLYLEVMWFNSWNNYTYTYYENKSI